MSLYSEISARQSGKSTRLWTCVAEHLKDSDAAAVVYTPDKEVSTIQLATRMALNSGRCKVKKDMLARLTICSRKADEPELRIKGLHIKRFFDDWDQCPGAFFDPYGYYTTTLSHLRRPSQRENTKAGDLFEQLWRHTDDGFDTIRHAARRPVAIAESYWMAYPNLASEAGDLFQWWGSTRDGRIRLDTYEGGMRCHCSFSLPAPDNNTRLRMTPSAIIELVGFAKFKRLRKAYADALYLMP